MSWLRTSDEPSVRIGLRRDLGAGKFQVSTEPVSEMLSVLELQVLKRREAPGRTSASRVQDEQVVHQTTPA
jgi:hypothetical protein